MFSITIPSCRTFFYNELGNVAACQPGVYCIYSDSDELLYIGKSVNLRERILSHVRGTTHTRDYLDDYDFYKFDLYYTDDNMMAELLEIYLINEWQPTLNKRSVNVRPPLTPKDSPKNSIWKVPNGYCAYIEDPDVYLKIKRTYLNERHGFRLVATYGDEGSSVPSAVQIYVPPNKKRNIRRLLGGIRVGA